MEEVHRLTAVEGKEMNHSKEVLAYEVTKIVHGEQEAHKAQEMARALFGGGVSEQVPQLHVTCGEKLIDALTREGVFSSKGEARRLIQQGGVTLNETRISDEHYVLQEDDFSEGKALLKKVRMMQFAEKSRLRSGAKSQLLSVWVVRIQREICV